MSGSTKCIYIQWNILLVIERKEILMHILTWMNPENIMLN